MAEQLKKIIDKIKEFWAGLDPKKKKIGLFATAGVLVFAVGLTFLLYMPKMGQKVLFPGMSSTEASEVYATLIEMGVQPEIDNQGNVRVPAKQWDDLQYQLSAKGYPKSTLTYGTFSSMTGFTTTEFEKRVALIYELQDRLQNTLKRWDGIEDAVVTINVPESSNFVWNQNKQEDSTASVTITMRPGYSLSPEQVSAIKNHTASAVPKLIAKNVVVTDAATGMEPPSADDSNSIFSAKRMDFERELERAIEENVKRLLVPTYGVGGVTAVAKVTVDYDKMVTERKEVLPQEDGNGVVTHKDERYSVGGNIPAEGIAGEEDNTDIPEYPNLEDLDGSEITDFNRSVDYDVGYVLTQIEKGEPILKEATVAVIVNDANFNIDKEDLLVELISKGVNIDPDNIRVANLENGSVQTSTQPGGNTQPTGLTMQDYLLFGGIGLGVLLLIAVIVFVILRMRKKRKSQVNSAEMMAQEEQRKRDLEQEIAEHKRMLAEEAQASANPKENAITEEIRTFAQRNPEVTANLIRSLMKEDR